MDAERIEVGEVKVAAQRADALPIDISVGAGFRFGVGFTLGISWMLFIVWLFYVYF